MHEVLVNRLGGLSLPRKSVVKLTDRPDMTLDVYRGRTNNNTTKQQQILGMATSWISLCFSIIRIRSRSQFLFEENPVWPRTFVSPSAVSRGAVVSYWRKYVHEVLVNRLGGLSLPRKSVVRLTDCPDMILDVYRGCKTPIQQQQHQGR